MNYIIIGMVLFGVIALAVYITVRICNHESESEWLVIKLKNDSVEPTDIYICKKCYIQEEGNWRYCKNCGSRMINGLPRCWYKEDIEIYEVEK